MNPRPTFVDIPEHLLSASVMLMVSPNNGVLTVHLPKSERAKPKSIEVKIG